MAASGMKVTTVRFGEDLWRLLEDEAEQVGISVSQYIREAALTRAAAAVTARGDDPLGILGQMSSPASADRPAEPKPAKPLNERAASMADELRSEANALSAQSRQAIRHSRQAIHHAGVLLERSNEIMADRPNDGARTEPEE
jgi:Mobilization protein NikA